MRVDSLKHMSVIERDTYATALEILRTLIVETYLYPDACGRHLSDQELQPLRDAFRNIEAARQAHHKRNRMARVIHRFRERTAVEPTGEVVTMERK